MIKSPFAAKSSSLYLVLFSLITLLYTINFHINDIWTENESFYAEAVREMFESGDFINIQYNYEPRFKKPPLTYWMIAPSVALFGNNELAIRLPILIAAMLTTILTYETARLLYDKSVAVLAFAMQAISLQFIAGKQYASPEIPLALFFTLTLFLFTKAKVSGNSRYNLLAFIALGLTVLTKGYPYYIVIGGIIALYILIESDCNPKKYAEALSRLQLPFGIPLALIIGTSWLGYMYWLHGDSFLQVLQKETLERAFTREHEAGLKSLFFYPEVILWSFFPYSLIFYLGLFFSLRNIATVKRLSLPLSWFFVMLIIFTASKGKIPTYFIQAHPAMAIIAAFYLINRPRSCSRANLFVNAILLLSGLSGIIISIIMIRVFELHPAYAIVPLISGGIILLPFFQKKEHANKQSIIHLQPFTGAFSALMVMSIGIMPQLENARPYDQIRSAIRKIPSIPKDLPIYFHGNILHNLPYYAERKMHTNTDPVDIQNQQGELLALIECNAILPEQQKNIIWQGDIYRRQKSESRLMLFIESYLKAKNGDNRDFTRYCLLYKQQ